MLLDYSQHRELYLVFHDDIQYPFSSWMKKGFKHVFAIERQALGWTCIDPSRSDLSCIILPATWENDIMYQFKLNNPNSTIVKLHVKQRDRFNYPRPGLISCVGAIQYVLGVWYPHVFTPYMLYNKLMKSPPNHIEVIEHDRTKQSKA